MCFRSKYLRSSYVNVFYAPPACSLGLCYGFAHLRPWLAALACGLGTGLAHPRLVFLYLEALLDPFFSLDLLSSFSYTLMTRS
jgi:hypothetical protein